MTRRSLWLAVPLLLSPCPLAAQMEHAHAGPPPARLGRVDFPTSCSAAAQLRVERGVALLHSFWYEEAARAFRDAAAADAGCALARWGVAASYLHPLWAPPTAEELRVGSTYVDSALALNPPTPLERGYVEALAAYYRDHATVRHPDRLRAWMSGLSRHHEAFPEDGEVAAFYALSLVAVANASPPDSTYALQRQAADILEPLFVRQPSHPGLAHYLIHATDAPPLARRGTRAADRYATIAPSVPHARHMPSHIYIRLGQWDASIASNLSSADAARRYEREQRLEGVWDQRLHAYDYLVYAYLQQGRYAAARRLVDEGASVQRFVPAGVMSAEYALAAMPARYAVERGQWREAAALAARPDVQGAPARAVTLFSRAIGAARSGELGQARADAAALAALDEELTRRPVPLWPPMVHAQRLAADAWVALAAGDSTRAVALATEAADLEDRIEKHPVTPGAILPARELLGDLLLEVGRAADALAAYRAALALQPARARSLMGAIRAAERVGDQAALIEYRRAYRALTVKADRDARQVSLARP